MYSRILTCRIIQVRSASEYREETDEAWKSLNNHFVIMITDLKRAQANVEALESPRFSAWREGWMGIIHMMLDRYDPAIQHFDKAVEIVRKEPHSKAREARIVSHRYNLACCFAMKAHPDPAKPADPKMLARMITELEYVAEQEPWRVARVPQDADFAVVLNNERFKKIVEQSASA